MQFVQRYTDEDLLGELKRVAGLVPGKLTKAAFDGHSTVSSATVFLRFGGWRAALVAAGLEDRSAHRDAEKMRQRRRRVRYTDEEIIAELRAVSARIGSSTITQNDVRDHSRIIGYRLVITRFGSFGAACEAAGLHLSKTANRWKDVELASNLRAVAKHLGRAPILADMGRPPSRISTRTYTYRFGSWSAAVEALADI